jgi:hypothetical protein
MKSKFAIWTLVFTLTACGSGKAGEPLHDESTSPHFFHRLRPSGGWHPYGGGLHWWNPDCFDWHGLPDDYCRKPLPKTCWPCRPPHPLWVPADNGNVDVPSKIGP